MAKSDHLPFLLIIWCCDKNIAHQFAGRPSGAKILKYPNIRFNESVQTQANEERKWKIATKTPSAGGLYKVTVEGNNKIELHDVMIGEVWIASGQSNMGFNLKNSFRAEEEIKKANSTLY